MNLGVAHETLGAVEVDLYPADLGVLFLDNGTLSDLFRVLDQISVYADAVDCVNAPTVRVSNRRPG